MIKRIIELFEDVECEYTCMLGETVCCMWYKHFGGFRYMYGKYSIACIMDTKNGCYVLGECEHIKKKIMPYFWRK